MIDLKENNFVKCDSPLGEYELHCTLDQMTKLVQDQKLLNEILGSNFRKPKDVDRLRTSILDDKQRLIKLDSKVKEIIKNGIPHDSFSNDCIDGTNKSLKDALKVTFKDMYK